MRKPVAHCKALVVSVLERRDPGSRRIGRHGRDSLNRRPDGAAAGRARARKPSTAARSVSCRVVEAGPEDPGYTIDSRSRPKLIRPVPQPLPTVTDRQRPSGRRSEHRRQRAVERSDIDTLRPVGSLVLIGHVDTPVIAAVTGVDTDDGVRPHTSPSLGRNRPARRARGTVALDVDRALRTKSGATVK